MMKLWQRAMLSAFLGLAIASQGLTSDYPDAETNYTFSAASRDGIGKHYLGREISNIMGHRGAAWLERRMRSSEELPDQVVQAMNLREDAIVADIGAGTGYFTLRISPLVPSGRVYAVDIQPEMLEVIRKRTEHRPLQNIVQVLGKPNDPMLPKGVLDAVLLVDAYHEFAYPLEMMRGIVRSLRQGGRVFLVEYRGEDPRVPIKPLHKMTQRQAIREMQAGGLRWVETRDFLPTQHFMVFEKPAET